MPFIDLNKANATAQPSANNAALATGQSQVAPTAGSQSQTNVQIDPTTGVRQIDGGDFATETSPVVEKLNAANAEAQAQVPQDATPVPEVKSDPVSEQEQVAKQVMEDTTAEDTLVIGTQSNDQAEVEASKSPQQEPVAAVVEPAPEVAATEATVTEPSPAPAAVPEPQPQPQVQPEPGLETPPAVTTEAETTSEPVAAAPAEAIAEPAPENTVMQDVMDRSLPELKIKEPANSHEGGSLETQLSELKPTIEQEQLESKQYGLNDLLVQSIKIGASDLHLTAGYRAMARVDGKLQMIKSQVLDHAAIKEMLLPVLKANPAVDTEHDKDIDMAYELPEHNARFRLNVGYQQQTMTATFRLIPHRIKTPEELYLPPAIKEYTKFKQGLVLVTGPTGSGKSTTLASLINLINASEPKHIITIEDPIEYTYPRGVALVDQRAVHIDTDSWPMALRATLRQDPDVVLIGEMRDVETMEAALQVAETGHLVFSTLHTNTAAQTIDRVIDAFPENKQSQVRTQLSSVLMAVVSQRLLPIAGGGRRIATEIMVVTAAIRNAIREGKVYQIDNMIQTGAEFGMVSMEKSLAQLVREGYVSTEMAQRYANKPEDLMSLLGKA